MHLGPGLFLRICGRGGCYFAKSRVVHIIRDDMHAELPVCTLRANGPHSPQAGTYAIRHASPTSLLHVPRQHRRKLQFLLAHGLLLSERGINQQRYLLFQEFMASYRISHILIPIAAFLPETTTMSDCNCPFLHPLIARSRGKMKREAASDGANGPSIHSIGSTSQEMRSRADTARLNLAA